MKLQTPNQKFELGEILATPNLLAVVDRPEMTDALAAHASGNWGEVGQEGWASNERALMDGTRLLSVYTSQHGIKFWIITEADRSVTTVLLPEDY